MKKPPLAIHYKFGGGVKVAGLRPWHKFGYFRFWEVMPEPATLGQVTEMWWHRISGTSPGNPAHYKLMKQRIKSDDTKNREFKPGAKPVLPRYAARLQDIEGWEE